MNTITVYADIETGGLELSHPIIQVAAIAVRDHSWEELATFETKLQFNESRCDPEALKVNGYMPEAWANALPEVVALVELDKFLKANATVQQISNKTKRPYYVAKMAFHNAAFDMPRIIKLHADHDKFCPAGFLARCTMQKAMWWFDHVGASPKSFQLKDLCDYFRISVDRSHEALADVRAAIALSKALVKVN